MKFGIRSLAAAAVVGASVQAAEFQVATNGNDYKWDSANSSFRTIQRAADLARPGDVITVHQGVYRERIDPPRGGASDRRRITYRAAPGENVVISGSEIVTNWQSVQQSIWKVIIPNSFFGDFNPYADLIRGDWFGPSGRLHHTGAVYLNGDWLKEAPSLDVLMASAGNSALWFGQVDGTNTTIWGGFQGFDPNEEQVEINVRQTVFYPAKAGVNYITVRGFTLEHAATPWAPPTAEQIGLVGTHWSRGWIIESNTISYSRCAGVSLGKYGDQWDNQAESAEGYLGTVYRALSNGWDRATVGHHIVRNNEISHCEQAGVVGSLGCAFSSITGNDIHDIYVQQLFAGSEMAAIKFHGAIDVVIGGNHLHHNGTHGIWLDWMAQGAEVNNNLLHDNLGYDLFCEVNHGPFIVANNLSLSRQSLVLESQGGAFAHNLFAGAFYILPSDGRMTPFFKPHSTTVAGLAGNPAGDVRFYNNLLVAGSSLGGYDASLLPVWMGGNVFLDGAVPCAMEQQPCVDPNYDPALRLDREGKTVALTIALDKSWTTKPRRQMVTSRLLGKAMIPGQVFENPNGTPIRINKDYFGRKRNGNNPVPGPFEIPEGGFQLLQVWIPRWVALTNASMPAFQGRVNGDRFVLSVRTKNNAAYTIQSSSDLSRWTTLTQTNGAPFEWSEPMDKQVLQRFYRLEITFH